MESKESGKLDRAKKNRDLIYNALKGIEVQIGSLADELLCANGGPCGIA